MQFIRIGIAGTAKNTGKTTTTIAIMEELRARGMRISLTSIGYDGESIDNITSLPKPRLFVEPGDVVASAQACFRAGSAKVKLLEDTGISTPLGNVHIAQVTEAGLVVTAGPNKTQEVKRVAAALQRLGPGVVIFDGALNRIAPFAETDGIVLATGASKSRNISLLAAQVKTFAHITRLPLAPGAAGLALQYPSCTTIFDRSGKKLASTTGTSLLTDLDSADILQLGIPEGGYLFVPGIIVEKALAGLVNRLSGQRFILVMSDPMKLLVTGENEEYFDLLNRLDAAGVLISVLKRVPLMAVTVNPFYPDFRVETNSYVPASIDPVRLQLTIKNAVNLPVFNIDKNGGKSLVDVIVSHAGRWESPETMEF